MSHSNKLMLQVSILMILLVVPFSRAKIIPDDNQINIFLIQSSDDMQVSLVYLELVGRTDQTKILTKELNDQVKAKVEKEDNEDSIGIFVSNDEGEAIGYITRTVSDISSILLFILYVFVFVFLFLVFLDSF